MERKKKGDPLYHSEVNELAKAAKKVGSIRGGGGICVRNMANGITISADTHDNFWGVVVCEGPNGEEDFDDNRYWVQRANVANNSTDDQEKVTLDKEPEESPKFAIVAATNLFEDNCGTHYVRPKTPVYVVVQHDQSSPPIPRYTLIVADEGTCRAERCDKSSSDSQSSDSQSSNSQSQSQSQSQSGGSGSGGSGSDKSTAIVPASWSPTGYTALFIAESPEVRFDDIIVEWTEQKNTSIAIDPKFLEVCEPDSVEVCGCVANVPVTVGAVVEGSNVEVMFSRQSKKCVRLVIRLTGIRKGFADQRFPNRTKNQFESNERFIRSAYPDA